MTERERLIQEAEGIVKVTESSTKLTYRHLVCLPSIMLLFTFVSISSYCVNEWTQQKCTLDYFENLSMAETNGSCLEVNQTADEKEKHDSIQHDTSVWSIYYKLSSYLPLLISTPLFASLSDAHGRKFLVSLTTCAILLKMGVSTAVIYYSASPWYIVISSGIEGFAGGTSSLICAMFAIAADVTSPKQRVFGIVIAEMSIYIASTISGMSSGFLIETLSLGFFYTSLICSSVGLLVVLVLTFVLPETLSKDKRRHLSVTEALMSPFKFYTSKEFKGRRLGYSLLLLTFSLCALTLNGWSDLQTLYLLGRPFCWGPADIGYFITFRYATGSIFGTAMAKLLLKFLSHEAVVMLAFLSNTASCIIEGFAKSTLFLYMAAAAATLSLLCYPMIRGIMSSVTSPDMQGSIFASAGFVEAIGSLLSSTVTGTLYAVTVYVWPGLVFEGLACLSILNLITLSMYMCVKPKQEPHTTSVNVDSN